MIKTDVFTMEWLMQEFEREQVSQLIRSCWAIDEMEAGVPMQTILDEIWTGYEAWAEQQISDGQLESEISAMEAYYNFYNVSL